jgi:hypothetical protein
MYRSRAEQLRTIANGLLGESDRDLLIGLAVNFERQAKSAEERARWEEAREA